MFTGIVQTKAVVNTITDKGQFRRLELRVASEHLDNIETGASIAINGCCLTVVSFAASDSEALVCFDIIDETLRLTNLGALKQGSEVNFERSLSFGSELGGHIVSGHIHTTATLAKRIDSENNCRMFLTLEPKWLEFILAKGFVAIDGASLTVGEVEENGFWLHLIPETLALTILGDAQEGQKINIEADQQTITIVETVKRVLAQKFSG
ncbi:riboflavin synthase [Aliidiomarina shirensis]|uniref:Riboflavin synthase n=1 Tax=Aliidiomarina shirensis TaxID=1048642 RepID=A0A432WXD6_9GAMM|nr:riboflavin synthase subunit alpha [Aliidiomarina shirensis]RUO38450.1 riboflavin synthase [Aliidiomarina shirensis]